MKGATKSSRQSAQHVFLLDELTSALALIALHEHRIFVKYTWASTAS
jgi:hypothetical protein